MSICCVRLWVVIPGIRQIDAIKESILEMTPRQRKQLLVWLQELKE